MTNLLRTSAVLFSIVLLSACSTIQAGRDFDVGMFAAKIQQNVTTQAEVRSWLGEPMGVGMAVESDGARYDEWDYYFAEGQIQDMSTAKVKILQVKFGKDGKVHSYNWTTTAKQ